MLETDYGKGHSIIAFPDEYVVLDLETTGLYAGEDDIIEVAAIKYANGAEVDRFQELINPGYPIPPFITHLTGISNAMLEGAKNQEAVMPSFFDFIGDSIVFGYNVNFDMNFLVYSANNVFNRAFKNDFVDVLRIARRTMKDLTSHKLGIVAEALGVNYDGAHRALRDCYITNAVYEMLKGKINEQYVNKEHFKEIVNGHCSIKAKDIHCSVSEFNEDGPFYQKVVVITGALEKMSRAQALQELINVGAIAADNVTKKTNYLIIADIDYAHNVKNGMTGKMKKAIEYKTKGQEISIIPEKLFYQMLKESQLEH